MSGRRVGGAGGLVLKRTYLQARALAQGDEEDDDPFAETTSKEEATTASASGEPAGVTAATSRVPAASPPLPASNLSPALKRARSHTSPAPSSSPPLPLGSRPLGSPPMMRTASLTTPQASRTSTTAPSSAPASTTAAAARSGSAHLAALLQRMGKTLGPRRRPPTSAMTTATTAAAASSTAIAASSAFDQAVRASRSGEGSARAEFLRDLTEELSNAATNSQRQSSSEHRFLGHDERISLADVLDDNCSLLASPAPSPARETSTRPRATKRSPSMPLQGTRTSPRISAKTSASQNHTPSRAHSPWPTAAAASAEGTPTTPPATSTVATKASGGGLLPRTLSSTFSSSAVPRTPQRAGTESSRASADTRPAAPSASHVADDADDDADAPFEFASDGPIAREQAALAESERRRTESRALAARLSAKRKRPTEEAAAVSTKRPSPAKPVARATTNDAVDDDPFEMVFSPSPAPPASSPPPPPSSTGALASPTPTAGPTATPTKADASATIKRTPVKTPFVIEEDPFDIDLSPAEPAQPTQATQATAAAASPHHQPQRSPSSALPPPMPTVASHRTVSAPIKLPPHVAVALGTHRLTPKKPPVASPPAPTSTGSPAQPAVAASAGSTSPGQGTPPAFPRATSVPSELLEQRRANLAQKSNTVLLLEALLGKTSPELREVESQALTPAQRVLLLKRPTPTTAHTDAYVTLAAKIGRKLKPKAGGAGGGVGYNAKQRSRGRRADGFLADMTPLLERTIAYLLANGADPNGRDADRNHALWLALQMRGSERVVHMLLERGAECVHAEESEDESTSEEEDDEDESAGRKSAARERRRADAVAAAAAARVAKAQDQLNPTILTQPTTSIANPFLAASRATPTSGSSGRVTSPDDPLTYERGSTVDLAMKMGSERHVVMLLRAGHLPSRAGRIRLMDFAKLHGFAAEAAEALVDNLWGAVKEADAQRVADVVHHLDRKMIDHKDQTGRTPLYCAVEQKDPSLAIIQLLLRAGANPNQTDCSLTPMAVFPLCRQAKKSTDVLSLLVRGGLDPRVEVSDSGQTLVDFSIEAAARPDSIQILQQALAQVSARDARRKEAMAQRAASDKIIGTDADPFRFQL